MNKHLARITSTTACVALLLTLCSSVPVAVSAATSPGLTPSAPDYFRLEPGSIRVYRSANGEDTFSIRVGNQGVMHNGHVHYMVTGYVNRPVLAYRDESTGTLYYLDEDTGKDAVLTSIEKGELPSGPWIPAPHRPCDQQQQVQADGKIIPYQGPAGRYGNVLPIHYRISGCADGGVTEETYVENIGLVQRTMQTIAGSVRYDLVHASVGPLLLVTESRSTAFSIGIRRPEWMGPRVLATLNFNSPGEGKELQMVSSQDYEVVLRDAKGKEVWRWSDGKFFTPQLRTSTVRHLSYEVEIPLQFNGILLHEGTYTVEAWLTTTQDRQFAAATTFVYTHPQIPGSQK